ncbi:MAG: diguanylate cyclase domain-containing protein [Vibrio sp.]
MEKKDSYSVKSQKEKVKNSSLLLKNAYSKIRLGIGGFFKNNLISIFTFVFSITMTLMSIWYVYHTQLEIGTNRLINMTSKQADRLNDFVLRDMNTIGAAANFYHSTNPSDWVQFVTFSKQLFENSDSLIGLQWFEKVEKKNINNHILHTRIKYPNFNIYTIPDDMTKMQGYIFNDDRPIYIATDTFPRTPNNISLLGFYPSTEEFERIIDNLSRFGEPNLSDKIRLLQDQNEQSDGKPVIKDGILVYYPVFDKETPKLLGVIVGVIRLSHYFQDVVDELQTDKNFAVQILVQGFEIEDDSILFESEAWSKNNGIEVSKNIRLSNQNWVFKVKEEKILLKNDIITLVGIAILGVIISSLLAFVANLMTKEKEKLRLMLEEKTTDLRYLVEHDFLTGLHNRRAFNDKFAELLQEEKPFTLISFDIDRFKQINDKYGHAAGDAMLQHVAKVISSKLKATDMLARIGGDEFSIFTLRVEHKRLQHWVDGICDAIAESQYIFGDKAICCSISLGASIWEGETAELLQYQTDQALYLSKENGRNQATIYQKSSYIENIKGRE